MIRYLLIISVFLASCSTKHYVSFYRNSRVYIDVMNFERVDIIRKKYTEKKPYRIDKGTLERVDNNVYILSIKSQDTLSTYKVEIFPDYFIWENDTCRSYGLKEKLFPKTIKIKKELF